ncbi:MAG: RNA methyltransferase [Candidatus Auribacterota bacterium]|jgi:TrmH family RNA methyltransferase
MKKANLSNIAIILVEPKEPGNIGSCCRAMKNMGITELRMVNPPDYHVADAFKMCYGADDLIHNAKVYTDLPSAIADVGYVVGTTRRKGKRRKPVYWLSDILPDITACSQDTKVGILFGREPKGLFNEELELCDALVGIPTRDDFPTLNLAQSVLVVCYELFLSRHAPRPTVTNRIPHEQLETLYEHLGQALTALGYTNDISANLLNRIITVFRRIFGRAGLEHRDAQMIHGVCSQIELKLNELRQGIDNQSPPADI